MKSEKTGMGTLAEHLTLEELLKETKETVATGLKLEEGNRIFGSVDLWNRQRRQRTSLQMRRWLN